MRFIRQENIPQTNTETPIGQRKSLQGIAQGVITWYEIEFPP